MVNLSPVGDPFVVGDPANSFTGIRPGCQFFSSKTTVSM